jgi:hypothetical protein
MFVAFRLAGDTEPYAGHRLASRCGDFTTAFLAVREAFAAR